jgi:hypothetical protein
MSTWSKLQQHIVAQLEKQNLTPIIPFESLLNCDIKKWEEICVANKAHHIELAVLWMYFMETSQEEVIELVVLNASYKAINIVEKLDNDSHKFSTQLIKNFWVRSHELPECFGKTVENESLAA